MDYTSVKELLFDFDFTTKIKIIDDNPVEHVYFEGIVYDYYNSKMHRSDLSLVRCSVEDNVLVVRAEHK